MEALNYQSYQVELIKKCKLFIVVKRWQENEIKEKQHNASNAVPLKCEKKPKSYCTRNEANVARSYYIFIYVINIYAHK